MSAHQSEEAQIRETVLTTLRKQVGMSVEGMVTAVLRAHPVDREHVVAAMWDCIEDGLLTYDATTQVRPIPPTGGGYRD